MFCSISGEPAEDAVISKKSGHIFERRLIVQHLDQNDGKCPVTGEELCAEDLLQVHHSKAVKPRTVHATSIPGLLSLFQNEWDSLMGETFTLKKHLNDVRQELSQALYQHDAACRVIARLLKERDEARAALTSLRSQMGSSPAAPDNEAGTAEESTTDAMQLDGEGGLPAAVLDKMKATGTRLSENRKNRKKNKPKTLPKKDQMTTMKQTSSKTLHKTTPKGIACVDLHPTQQNLLLTGGVDKEIKLLGDGKVIATMTGHHKRVNAVLFHPTSDMFFSCSADKTVKHWSRAEGNTKFEVSFTDTTHTAAVNDVCIHPTGDYLLSASNDQSWAFHDIKTQQCLHKLVDDTSSGYKSIRFHPDGLILGTGTGSGQVRIYDTKNRHNKAVAEFVASGTENSQRGVSCIAFSENGYYMASGTNKTVQLWDLRRLKEGGRNGTLTSDMIKEFSTEGNGGGPVGSIDFDFSGTYLAIGAGAVTVMLVKKWEQLCHLTEHNAAVTGVRWTRDARILATSSMDRCFKVYETQ